MRSNAHQALPAPGRARAQGEGEMIMPTKYDRTSTAVQKRDRCMWEIGDALLAECGMPGDRDSQSRSPYHDGSRAKLEAVASEIDHLKIEGYTASYLGHSSRCEP